MSGFLKIFAPAPAIPEIQNPEEVGVKYKYWRIRILYSMFIGYAFYYFTRKSFVVAMPGLIEQLGMDKAQLGLLGTIFSFSYGFSKFASGILSDRSNPRYFMAAGLFMTGAVNVMFGLSSSLILFAFFWGLNGWFQGFGWPSCARFLTHWYSHSERGSWWSTWNISQNVGAFVIPFVISFALQYFDWRFAMFIPGVTCMAGAFLLVNRLRDTPESLGLPPIEKWRNDYVSSSVRPGHQSEKPTTRQLLFDFVLKNKYIWLLAIAYLFVYVVRTGVNDWTSLFLQENKGYTIIEATGCVSLFEVGGAVGSLTAGWASDRVFGAKRGPVNVIFAFLMFISILCFWYVPADYAYLDSAFIFFMGFSIFGPQLLIGVHAAEVSHKEASATATGFVGWFAYTGAAFAGFPLGLIAEVLGWEGYFYALMLCSVIAFLLLIPLWRVTEYSRTKQTNQQLA